MNSCYNSRTNLPEFSGISLDISLSAKIDVSNVQHRATFRRVYPPPPKTNNGLPSFLTKSTHSLKILDYFNVINFNPPMAVETQIETSKPVATK
jgi:hypothetical protein